MNKLNEEEEENKNKVANEMMRFNSIRFDSLIYLMQNWSEMCMQNLFFSLIKSVKYFR